MPVDDEVRTDKERMATWGKGYAIKANQVAREMGLERMGLVEEPLVGYVVPFLDGIWLRAPYLHNGSVPTLRDLLRPAAQRPQLFWRGYDVYDQDNVGFISQGEEAQRAGTPFDTTLRSNSNSGHEFGTALAEEQKLALLEYLKGL
jgi:cytochrome c peroxidase